MSIVLYYLYIIYFYYIVLRYCAKGVYVMKMKKKASILAASLAVMMLGVQSVYAAPTKPDVKILATGGTIAGSAA